MTGGVPEWAVMGMLGVIGTVAWWGVRRIVAGQDSINATLVEISGRLAQINGRVGKMETRMDMHEKHDDERHEALGRETATLWRKLEARGQ